MIAWALIATAAVLAQCLIVGMLYRMDRKLEKKKDVIKIDVDRRDW